MEALSGWSGNKPGNDSEIVDIASYIHHTLTFVTSLAVTLPFYMLSSLISFIQLQPTSQQSWKNVHRTGHHVRRTDIIEDKRVVT